MIRTSRIISLFSGPDNAKPNLLAIEEHRARDDANQLKVSNLLHIGDGFLGEHMKLQVNVGLWPAFSARRRLS